VTRVVPSTRTIVEWLVFVEGEVSAHRRLVWHARRRKLGMGCTHGAPIEQRGHDGLEQHATQRVRRVECEELRSKLGHVLQLEGDVKER
jgi:hypothetical protein